MDGGETKPEVTAGDKSLNTSFGMTGPKLQFPGPGRGDQLEETSLPSLSSLG